MYNERKKNNKNSNFVELQLLLLFDILFHPQVIAV